MNVVTARPLGEAWAEAVTALPQGWHINCVQWGDDIRGPGPEYWWYATAIGPETDDPEDRDGRIGSGDSPSDALVNLANAMRAK